MTRTFVLARHGESTLNVDRVVNGDRRALESLLARPEAAILVVAHEIPVRYALNAAEGSDDPDAPHHAIANATPYLFGERELADAAARLATRLRET